MRTVDDQLVSWADVEALRRWEALLLGNGASIAVWRSFSYSSLFDVAGLSDGDRLIFEALDTTDFEQVLRTLQLAGMVCDQLGHAPDADARYGSVRTALVNAVHRVHVPWMNVPDSSLKKIAAALRKYRHVFSTNYDLLLYWAAMNVDAMGFRAPNKNKV
ncbi:DUF4917 family protein [Pyxidicoccus sp. 3LG]